MAKKNESGKYRGRVQIGVDKDGKAINKYVCAGTLRELDQKKEYVRNHYIEGQPLREDMPFYQYAEEWYRLKKEPFISDASRSAYRTMFNKHILPAFGLRHLRAISASELQNFINSFADSSKSQITLAVGTLKALFANAYAEGIIERDPSVSLIRPKPKKKTERRALTDQETEYVLETMKRHEHGLYLAVLYYLGLRRGEALGLQWGDFDFDEDLVHIQRDIDFCGSTARDGDLKTDAADRYVPIPGELRAMLTKMRGFPQQYVFHTETGQPWPQSSFKRIWLSLMEDAHCVEEREIKAGTKRKNDIVKRLKPTLTPHYFRHNFATLLFEAGVEPLDCHEDSGPHGLPNHSQYLHAPQFRDDEEIQRGYGRSIPPEAGSQRRTGQGQERKGKEIEETGCGCQPAVGGKILTDTMKAMTPNAPWPILFC